MIVLDNYVDQCQLHITLHGSTIIIPIIILTRWITFFKVDTSLHRIRSSHSSVEHIIHGLSISPTWNNNDHHHQC